MIKQFYLTLTSTPILGQSGFGCNVNEGVHYIPQTSRTEASLLDKFSVITGHSLGGLNSLQRWYQLGCSIQALKTVEKIRVIKSLYHTY